MKRQLNSSKHFIRSLLLSTVINHSTNSAKSFLYSIIGAKYLVPVIWDSYITNILIHHQSCMKYYQMMKSINDIWSGYPKRAFRTLSAFISCAFLTIFIRLSNRSNQSNRYSMMLNKVYFRSKFVSIHEILFYPFSKNRWTCTSQVNVNHWSIIQLIENNLDGHYFPDLTKLFANQLLICSIDFSFSSPQNSHSWCSNFVCVFPDSKPKVIIGVNTKKIFCCFASFFLFILC